MKVCLAGEGAQGLTHVQVLQQIEGVEVVSLAYGLEADGVEFARTWEIPHAAADLESCLGQPGIEAVVLATPNSLHAEQAALALGMGKHVLVELPMGMSVEEARRVAALEEETGRVCMVCHTLRYSPVQREIHRRVRTGELHLHHLVSQTYFFRRENRNRFGKPRTWTDELLWHQACHLIDFVFWLFEEPDMEVWAQAGPEHPRLGIPMDLTLGLRSKGGCLVSGVLSFNHHGPIEISYRFIGEETSLRAAGGRLLDYEGREIPLPEEGGVERQDREFFAAIEQGRRPLTSCSACLPVMEIIERIQRCLEERGAR